MKIIPVIGSARGAKVDDADFEELSKYVWRLHYAGYAIRKKNSRCVYMHRFLMGFPKGKVDHRDMDPLNNQRDNLRTATNSQNCCNRLAGKRTAKITSKFKGVTWNKSRKLWRADICVHYKSITIGRFDSEVSAAIAYDKKAIELHGEFARTNF